MKPADIFRSGMVLQHGKPVRIFGEGDGEVTVVFAGRKQNVSAENGRWCAEFPAFACGGPHGLNVAQGSERYDFHDILIGEVIFTDGEPGAASSDGVRVYTDADGWTMRSSAIGEKLRREHCCPVGIVCGRTDAYAGFAHTTADALGAPLTLRLGEIFCDGMVLQHGKPIRIFGNAHGEVTAEFLGRTQSVCADGRFDLEFPAEECGGPYTLSVRCGGKEVVLRDVMVGEVILCSGQSNMEFRVSEGTPPPEPFIADDRLRVFVSDRPHGGEPILPSDGWVKVTPENAPDWSALAYFWGVEARRVLCEAGQNTAVGIVVCAQGGSMLQAWVDSRRFTGADAAYGERLERSPLEYTWNYTGELYRLMLEPLIPYSFGSVIWYQGENNARASECRKYRRMLEILIESWREDFLDAELPFVVVVLPENTTMPDHESWEVLRQQQRDASMTVPGVIAVESGDLCEADNIHPPTKWKLAARLWRTMFEAGLVYKKIL